MPAKKLSSENVIEIKRLDLRTVTIRIEGLTSLIVHNWSQKARIMMLNKQMGKSVIKKEAKDPQADYEASMYRFADGRHGFPAQGIKAAIVGGCRMFEDLPMTQAKIAIFIHGEQVESFSLVEIHGEPTMREDMVRLETGVADIRYRAEYKTWWADLKITYNARMISEEQMVNLVDAAGMGGIGEWRPSAPKSSSGTYGMFRVATPAV
jgi:hypothetical protein